MPPVAEFPISADIPDRADTQQIMQDTGGAADSHFDLILSPGCLWNGTFFINRAYFCRFELAIPAGAKILGVMFRAVASPGSVGPTIPMVGGFTNRQGGPNAWELASGFVNWTLHAHVPFGQLNTLVGVIDQHDKFVGGAPAFDNVSMNTVATNNGFWSIGSGTQSGGTAGDAPGLVSQLQSYLDDPVVEASRGATEAGSISAMLQFYKEYPAVADNYQFLREYVAPPHPNNPRLIVEWSLPASVSSRSAQRPVVRSRGETEAVVRSRGSIESVVSSRGESGATVESRRESKPTIRSRGEIT